MEEKEKLEALSKYDRRETFWSGQSLQQLGYSLNLFFTLGLGFLGYIITKRPTYPAFKFISGGNVEWKLVFYYMILLLLFSSVILGACSIIIRLYDLRITRHITGIRKTTMKVLEKYLPEDHLDLSKDNFFKAVFFKVKFIHITKNSEYENISKQFDLLRKQAKILGKCTWNTHITQIVLITIAALIYGISIL